MELVYIAFIVIGVCILIYCLRKKPDPTYEDSDAVSKPPESSASVPSSGTGKPVPPQKSSVSVLPQNTRSLDEEYARTHRMWICPYCETMNPYPAGVSPEMISDSKAAPVSGSASMLRGDLIKKAADIPAGSVSLICAACGKPKN